MSRETFGLERAFNQAKISAFAKILAAALNLVVQIYIVQKLDVNSYATFTLFIAVTSVLVLISMFGLDRLSYRLMPVLQINGKFKEIFAFVFSGIFIRILFVLFLVFLFDFLSGFFSIIEPMAYLSELRVQLICFVLLMILTDSLSIFCSGLGIQAKQSLVMLFVGLIRSVAVIIIFVFNAVNLLNLVAWVFVLAELVLFLLIASVIVRHSYQLNFKWNGGQFEYPQSVKDIFLDGITTQLGYLIRVPFSGPFLRIMVASFASPAVVAAYGFFQTIFDRIYQFMPTVMLKGVVEPCLSADYSMHSDIKRVSLIVSLLVRVNAIFLFAIVMVVLGGGEYAVDLLTNGKYGAELMIAVFVILQMLAQLLGETLWVAMNPLGRLSIINRAWNISSVFSLFALFAAAYYESLILVLLAASLPYCLLFIVLRWFYREKIFEHELGFFYGARLIIPLVTSIIVSNGLLVFLGQSVLNLILSLTVAFLVYVFLIVKIGLFKLDEVGLVQQVSPKLSVIIGFLVIKK